MSEFEISDGPTGNPRDYHADNEFFSRLDAWLLQTMLRYLRPNRLIEAGCGWSSRVIERVNRDYLDDSIAVFCVDPRFDPAHPDAIVDAGSGIVYPDRVQDLPENWFWALIEDDVLFVDGSHMVETGGDAVYIVNEVLPRLSPGVVVHFHDIFLPYDYPVPFTEQGRGYAEQYLVQAFLAFNSEFEVMLGSAWMIENHSDLLSSVVPGYPEKCADGGASLWIRRKIT